MMTLTFCLGFSDHEDFVLLFEKLWNDLKRNSKKFRKLKFPKPPFKLVETPEIEIGTAWRRKLKIFHFINH